MLYLVVDGMMGGTGLRDKYNSGYLVPEELGLSKIVAARINKWLGKYEQEHYKGFVNNDIIDRLDEEGKAIACIVKAELKQVKIEYYSNARLKSELIG